MLLSHSPWLHFTDEVIMRLLRKVNERIKATAKSELIVYNPLLSHSFPHLFCLSPSFLGQFYQCPKLTPICVQEFLLVGLEVLVYYIHNIYIYVIYINIHNIYIYVYTMYVLPGTKSK